MSVQPAPTDPNSFMIHVDARGLAWTYATDTEPRRANLILMVTTFDKKGKEIKQDAKRLSIAAKDAPPTGRLERSLDIHYVLTPEPKAVRARFVVRVDASGRIGTADVTLGSTAAVSASHPATTPGAPAAVPASASVPPS